MKKILGLVLAALLLVAPNAEADLDVVREIVITPKKGRVAANIGSVNQSFNVRMVKAQVGLWVGALPESASDPVDIRVHGVFTMTNDSADALALTVGFPVSDSQFSGYAFESFRVTADGEPRSVFNRRSGYPRMLKHEWVSGPDEQGFKALPDFSEARDSALSLFGEQRVGKHRLQNLMVWKETFSPNQTRSIVVDYALRIPPQRNQWMEERVRGNYKGIWPQEANRVPLAFAQSIPRDVKYYFFDYYLVSGASWKGTIGEEVITLRLDPSWKGHELLSNYGFKLIHPKSLDDGKTDELTYVYFLMNAEPAENVLFALKRP